MAQSLLIVESPTKAKTIERFLKQLNKPFQVSSCFGHIRDLRKQNMGIDIDHGYKPIYEISESKKDLVRDLKSKVKKANEIWLATDEDREGESISWHLCEVLGLDTATTKRIVFHEITKEAIENSIANPRHINMNLVYAQQARRIMDRIVGFSLSSLLKKKLNVSQVSLSAGRVQSVVLRLVVEKEVEINEFKSQKFFKISGTFHYKGQDFQAEAKPKPDLVQAREWLEACKNAIYKVQEVSVQPRELKPQPPFTTSTLQQEAARKLGYSVDRTMRLAQQLYENGFITYMRTDSVSLSKVALSAIASRIGEDYGENYINTRNYKTKSANAQEAHEAIRPTDINLKEISLKDSQALYKLIWQRTLASQMSNAKIERTKVEIAISTIEDKLQAVGDSIIFQGYLKAYKDLENNLESQNLLPILKSGDRLNLKVLQALERHTNPPARYGERTLVKKMEEIGIGRPSTYAQTISTLLKRNYMQKVDRAGSPHAFCLLELNPDNQIKESKKIEPKGAEKDRLLPMDLGKFVTRYLINHFENIMDYNFTASIEKDFDTIARGDKNWITMIDNFYRPFINEVNHNLIKSYSDDLGSQRLLGIDPKSKLEVWAKFGRYGPMIQIGTNSEDIRPRFASIPTYLSMESISLEDALNLFNLPKVVGILDGHEVILNNGPYGPYASCGDKRYSLGRGIDVYNIENQEVVEMVIKKRLLPREVGVYDGEKVAVNLGPFGPYLMWKQQNFPLKKGMDVYSVSAEEVIKSLQNHLDSIEKRTLKSFPKLNAIILRSRFGPVIKIDKNRYPIPKDLHKNLESLTEIEVEKIIQDSLKSPKTASKGKTASKNKSKK